MSSDFFENSYTKYYHKTEEYNIPKKYIIYKYENGEDIYLSMKDVILENLNLSIFELYQLYSNNLKFTDFCLLYFFINISEKKEINVSKYIEQINNSFDIYNRYQDESDEDIVNKYEKYTSEQDFISDFTRWFNQYNNEITQDLKTNEKIKSISKLLLNYEAIEPDKIILDKMKHEYAPNIDIDREKKTKKSFILNNKIGILIFNEINCSLNIPYVQYNNSHGEKFYKIFDSDSVRDFSKIVDQNIYSDNKLNTIFFKVSDPDFEEEISNKESVNKSYYINCRYNLDTNKLDFVCEERKKENIILKLNSCYSMFNISKKNFLNQYNIEAKLIFENVKINPYVIHFMILNELESGLELNGLLGTYFFVDESKKVIADKAELISIKYKSLTNGDEKSKSSMPYSLRAKLFQENENLVIYITKAEDEKTLGSFIDIFSRFLSIYRENESRIWENLSFILDGDEEDSEEIIQQSEKTGEKKIKQIRDTFKKIIENEGGKPEESDELFSPGTTGYTRICECKKQPILLTDRKDIEDWENKTFIYKNQEQKRQIGSFIPVKGEVKFNYVCPEDDYPFPTVAKNNDKVNSKKYPFVPCCAKSDEINNPNSNYNNFYSVKEDKDNPNKNYKLFTMKSLEDNREGEISKQIQSLLDSKENESEKFKFSRLGFGKSENSLIHCVLRAVKDKGYMDLINDTKSKEKYCVALRKKITTLLPNFYEICNQEAYNISKNILKRRIDNANRHFNSEIYYRTLEELFNVNIYVILHRESMSNKEIKNEDPGIEIPFHTLTHIRPFRKDRKTIVILKHLGGEMENLKTPLYDLIFNTGILLNNEKGLAIKEREFLFDENINTLLYEALINYKKSIIFQFNIYDEIEGREYPYSRIYWPDIFKDFTLESQNIDANGKLRGINISVLKSPDIKITVFLPPSQPLNLPVNNIIYISKYDIVKSIFGTPTKEIKDGLWFKVMDFEYGIFIPCETTSIEKYPEPPIPLYNNTMENNNIINFRDTKKYSEILIKYIIWGLRSNNILNLEDYLNNYEKYIVVNESVRPNIKPVEKRSYISDTGNFTYLNKIWPEYFTKDNKVQLYPELYDKIIKYLAIYYKDNDGLSLPPDPYLSDVFKYEWDFKPMDQNRILIGEEHLKQWLKLKENEINYEIQIAKELNKELLESDSEQPFIFEYQKRYFLIQKFKDGNFTRALNCGHIWNTTKINKGYDITNKPFTFEVPHIIYDISPSYQLFITKENDMRNDNKEYVSLIKFGNKYLSMLEI
jgi:hypothetical protein